ncbi:hypothetical protein D9M71_545430 [compost metagenome]
MHVGAFNPWYREDRVINFTQCLQIIRIKNVAIAVGHNDPQGITKPLQVALVSQIILNVSVVIWNDSLVACIQLQIAGLIAEECGESQTADDYPHSILEQQSL